MNDSGLPPSDANARLGQLSTIWTMVLRAHGGPGLAEGDAQRRFMERYHPAIYRYLMTAVRDADAAEEFQSAAGDFLSPD